MDYLLGITSGDWFKLLYDNRFAIPPKYWGRATKVTILSLINSRLNGKENKIHRAAIEAAEIKNPLFIIGHWRSGTTLLHNLFSLDDQFAYPNLFQITHPHTFLSREEVVVKHLGNVAPEKRPMDNMEVTYQSPGEDETAIAQISLCSPLIGWSFQKSIDYYEKYLTFQTASAEDVDRWKQSMIWYLKKLTLRYQKPLVLKSPNNTTRVRLLLELFPGARFVHIHRNPYAVFQSTQRLYERIWPHVCLQKIEWEMIHDRILSNYRTMYEAFFKEKSMIPQGQFCEVCFEELEKDIVGQFCRIYEKLNIPGFLELKPKVQRYVDSLDGYKKNKFDPLPEELCKRVEDVWLRSFEEWDYPLDGRAVS